MRPPLFIAIAVHKAQGMDVLPGVIESIDGIAAWARNAGYDVVQIDDRATPVVMDRIKDELTPAKPGSYERDPALLLDRPRIIVYFCGHGLHAPQDQYWILTPGPQQGNHRISASTFRDVLATYGPMQVGILSDACRSPEAVTGTARSPVDQYDAAHRVVQKDNFISAQMGAASFAMPAKDGASAYCVFSRVLLRALSAPAEKDALSPVYLKLNEHKVSSESLADYLEKYVPDAALDIGKLQTPQCDPGFRAFDDVYVEFPTGAAGTSMASASGSDIFLHHTGPATTAISSDDPKQNERFLLSRSEWRRPYVRDLVSEILLLKGKSPGYGVPGPLLLSSEFAEPRVSLPGTEFNGPNVGELLQKPNKFRGTTIMVEGGKGFANSGRSSVYLAHAGPWHCAITMHHNLWCTAILDNYGSEPGARGGTELLTWGDWVDPGEEHLRIDSRLSAAEALKGLSSGALSTRDIPRLASDMRYEKHVDTMYGIIPAYLYHRIGDVDNIRRMCSFYNVHNQDVPFDIALLTQLRLLPRPDGGFFVDVPPIPAIPPEMRQPDLPDFAWQATAHVTVNVAGVTPTLRLGWQMLVFSKHAMHRKCLELAEHLTESSIATLYGDVAGARLVHIFKEIG